MEIWVWDEEEATGKGDDEIVKLTTAFGGENGADGMGPRVGVGVGGWDGCQKNFFFFLEDGCQNETLLILIFIC